MDKEHRKHGGKTAEKNMTAAERSARAKKASMAAAKKGTAKRLAQGHAAKGKAFRTRVLNRARRATLNPQYDPCTDSPCRFCDRVLAGLPLPEVVDGQSAGDDERAREGPA